MKDKIIKLLNIDKLKEVSFMYISAISEKGIMFLLTFILARLLSSDGFGEYSYYMALGGIVFTLFDLGGDFFQTKKITQSNEGNFVCEVISAKFLVFLCVVSIGSLYIMFKQEKVIEFILVIIAYFMDSISSVFKSINYVFERYYKESVILLIEKSVMLVFVVIMLIFSKKVECVFFAILFSKGVFVCVRYLSSNNLNINIKLNILNSLKLIKEASIFIIHALLSTVFFQVDILMIKHMMGYSDVGTYNAAVKVVLASMIIPEILFKFFYPKISKYIKVDLRKSIFNFKQFLNIELLMVIPVAIVMFFGSSWIISLLYGGGYSESVIVLRILILQIIFRYCMYPFTALLSAGDKQTLKTITSAICVGINCGINYLLIPAYGISGAAIATVITEFTLLVLYIIFCGSFFTFDKCKKVKGVRRIV